MVYGLANDQFEVPQFNVAWSKLPTGLLHTWGGGDCSPEITLVRLQSKDQPLIQGSVSHGIRSHYWMLLSLLSSKGLKWKFTGTHAFVWTSTDLPNPNQKETVSICLRKDLLDFLKKTTKNNFMLESVGFFGFCFFCLFVCFVGVFLVCCFCALLCFFH